ncbi:hypothetical protein LCGC14_3141700 [marine sediment metagenome]|uniref:Uncharacterized protein n=1 Tax=marine sediment metagenome TaxID=412755 RepID=A0A0F8VWK5_9ZZZZ
MLLATGTAFVIKQEGGTQNDDNMICAFNFNGFLKKEEFFSGSSPSQQMIIDDYSTNFYDNYDKWNTKWDDSFLYKIGFTSGSISEFTNYVNEIFEGTSNYATYLKEILTYNAIYF